ncbi:ABC transporter permease [Paraburkholderia sp. Ac-20336]|uniref:ABC transporter permease n=1 Tax=Burkholderiaceae TaxID=119060 RepID=UPI0014230E4E|nr:MULTISPECIES: ABC transporter permease [Burkholderiaceae]MBN3805485.1 ABC transporter permease [Paraburkholderia sp. Ac-20336]MBN3849495.1 ABC transporter permease [Paraburkholderia sp. Ac-20342]NIF52816.1 ABC transporter permease [Burkholderia sp. Ax-1724]NIF78755.1 ABC transporter permease [Paraburkholderia sp. Cy-641]
MSAVLDVPAPPRRGGWRRLPYMAGRAAVPIVVLALWQWFGASGKLPPYLSFPSDIVSATRELAGEGELWTYLRDSLLRLIGGFAIGSAIGAALGLVAGLSKPVGEFADPLVAFVYPVPKIAFLPIMLLIFGLTSATQTAIVALSVSFPVFLAAQHAVQQMDKHLVWVARNFETPFPTLLLRVVLPATLPGIFAGLRVALALSFVSLFAAELIGAKTGLSLLITEGQDWVRYDIMLTGVVAYGLLGFVADRLLMAVRKRALRGVLLGTEEAQR